MGGGEEIVRRLDKMEDSCKGMRENYWGRESGDLGLVEAR